MLKSFWQRQFADPNSAPALVRRLLLEQAWSQRWRYALAFGLMLLAAGATALGAYLIGPVINAAYVDRDLPSITAWPKVARPLTAKIMTATALSMKIVRKSRCT